MTQLILETVEPNSEAFRITLCAVKEWAITNGIYSNILGFLGGINFAIMVAWVCKQHPEQEPSTLLRIFFRTFSKWYVENKSTFGAGALFLSHRLSLPLRTVLQEVADASVSWSCSKRSSRRLSSIHASMGPATESAGREALDANFDSSASCK